jgi:hypothetical protein
LRQAEKERRYHIEAGAINGTKAKRSLNSLKRSANGVSDRDKAFVKSSPSIIAEANCPRNYLWAFYTPS